MATNTQRRKSKQKKCSFIGCKKSRRDFPDLHLFRFPTKRPSICKEWVVNCANESLVNLPEKSLSGKLVCENHFTEDCFFSNMKTSLKKTAIPTLNSLDSDVCETVQMEQLPCSNQVPAHDSETNIMKSQLNKSRINSNNNNYLPKGGGCQMVQTEETSCSSQVLDHDYEDDEVELQLDETQLYGGYNSPKRDWCQTVQTQQPSYSIEVPAHDTVIDLVETHLNDTQLNINSLETIKNCWKNTDEVSWKPLFSTVSPETPKDKQLKGVKGSKQAPIMDDTSIIIKLMNKLNKVRALKKSYCQKVRRLERKKPKITKEIILQTLDDLLPPKVSKFVALQIQHAYNNKHPWTDEEKMHFLTIRYKTPALFSQMKSEGFSLPNRTTMSRWLKAIELHPGECPDILKSIKKKSESNSVREMKAVSMFDKMTVQKNLDFDSRNGNVKDKNTAVTMENNTSSRYFENFCRICSCEQEKENLVSVFRNDDLLEKIASCLPITIHAEDRLPHEICENCCNSIEHCFEFVKKAQSSQNYFFNCLNDNPSVKIERDDDYIVETLEDNEKKVVSLDLEGSFQCDLCGEQMNEAVELDRHIEEQHTSQSSMPPNTEFTINKICSLCGQLFDYDHSYFFHKSESQNECSVCKKMMPSKCLLNRHIQHACKQLNFCPHCHKAFSAKMSFLKHVQDHTGEKFETDCLACDRKAKKKEEVMEHTCALADNKTVSSGKRYKCYVCGLSYKRQLNLARHCLQHEPKTAWKYKCVKCNDVFEKEKKLQTHYERVHKISRSWVCRFCGKSLSTKLSVQIHERIHTQVKPFVCEWCGNAFRCRPNLIQHQAMHTGIRPHKCHICGKKFSRPFFLQTHLRIHTGERPYECDICERRFTQLTDMRRHRKRHDKPSSRVSQPTIYVIQDAPEEIVEEVAFDDDFPMETVELKLETSE